MVNRKPTESTLVHVAISTFAVKQMKHMLSCASCPPLFFGYSTLFSLSRETYFAKKAGNMFSPFFLTKGNQHVSPTIVVPSQDPLLWLIGCSSYHVLFICFPLLQLRGTKPSISSLTIKPSSPRTTHTLGLHTSDVMKRKTLQLEVQLGTLRMTHLISKKLCSKIHMPSTKENNTNEHFMPCYVFLFSQSLRKSSRQEEASSLTFCVYKCIYLIKLIKHIQMILEYTC